MIQLRSIRNLEPYVVEQLTTLYVEAFPIEERRDVPQLLSMVESCSEMCFCAIECDGNLSGLIVYWIFDEFVYLEHFAVFSSLRNGGIGQNVLRTLQQKFSCPIIFEVEPAEDDLTKRRVKFYERNGFFVVEQNYCQPAYRAGDVAPALWIMSNRSCDELPLFLSKIKEKVYDPN